MGHEHHNHGHEQSNAWAGDINAMSASATMHCLTGCAIGEIAGLVIGEIFHLGNALTIAVSILLAFVFGYGLSLLPLLKGGIAFAVAVPVVLASDSLSILTMEIFDNLVMVTIPGAMNAGLVNPIFWLSLIISLLAAFAAAFPVNRYLLRRGKGHALVHQHMGHGMVQGERI